MASLLRSNFYEVIIINALFNTLIKSVGLENYSHNVVDGSSLIADPEKTLHISNEFHRKKLRLAIRSLDENQVNSFLQIFPLYGGNGL